MEPAALGELKERLGVITDLEAAHSVLAWDMEVWMPPSGGDSRGMQLGTLASVVHERQIDDRIGELLSEVQPYAASLPADALFRLTYRSRSSASSGDAPPTNGISST